MGLKLYFVLTKTVFYRSTQMGKLFFKNRDNPCVPVLIWYFRVRNIVFKKRGMKTLFVTLSTISLLLLPLAAYIQSL
jgi:hypothetical protein